MNIAGHDGDFNVLASRRNILHGMVAAGAATLPVAAFAAAPEDPALAAFDRWADAWTAYRRAIDTDAEEDASDAEADALADLAQVAPTTPAGVAAVARAGLWLMLDAAAPLPEDPRAWRPESFTSSRYGDADIALLAGLIAYGENAHV